MLELKSTPQGITLPVKVVPGASRTRIMGILDARLRIAVAAAPEKGRANAALCEYVAKLLKLKKRDVTVTAGHASPLKTLCITGATPDQIRAALQPPRGAK